MTRGTQAETRQDVLEKQMLELLGTVWGLKRIKKRAVISDLDEIESKLLKMYSLVNSDGYKTYIKETQYKIG